MKSTTMEYRSTGTQPGPRQRMTSKGTEEMFSLRDILDTVLDNWKWFLLSAIVCVGLARLYLVSRSYVFQRQAMMLVSGCDVQLQEGPEEYFFVQQPTCHG